MRYNNVSYAAIPYGVRLFVVSEIHSGNYLRKATLLMLIHANNKHGLVKNLSQCGIGSNITQKHYSRSLFSQYLKSEIR